MIFFLFRFMLVFSCVLQIVSYLFLVILTICCTSFRKLVFSINPYSGLSFPLNCIFTMLVYSLVFLSLNSFFCTAVFFCSSLVHMMVCP